jgi:hypothetical protein
MSTLLWPQGARGAPSYAIRKANIKLYEIISSKSGAETRRMLRRAPTPNASLIQRKKVYKARVDYQI